MSTNLSPIQRYIAMLITGIPGRPLCQGWKGKIDKYGNAHFTWTENGRHRTGNAARWRWEYHRGPLGPEDALRNTCGWSACQRLSHWTVIERSRNLTPAERYERAVDRSGGPDACHPWTVATDKDGYGLLTWREGGKTHTRRAHRFGWELKFGPLPKGAVVRHTCDNPPCQNEKHWFTGTVADNNRDKVSKGRERYGQGENHYRATLTDQQVKKIREVYTGARGEISALARQYKVSPRTMNHIIRGDRRKLS